MNDGGVADHVGADAGLGKGYRRLQLCRARGREHPGGTKRDKPNGTKGFLQKSAVSCGFLRFPAVFCENLRLRNAVIPRKSENLQKSANLAHLSLLVCPSYFPLREHPPTPHPVGACNRHNVANWRSYLETVHILTIFEGFFIFWP